MKSKDVDGSTVLKEQEVCDLTCLAEDKDQWRARMNNAMKFSCLRQEVHTFLKT